ncbi:Coiled-coil domain-containing protein [Penicillium cinerascens]|uniref:Coiled-coil domain-containing protein n=1 Tax=Penicillium cinerascens TaxID=70096 RepID=A0A9W9MP20_9EURO|nr:Coiled-coil domain-containing protein [Penicillium cinerascens]KAJ5204885.1 Coiled-coil domain-containing protein [Penicillium cinerascens]
MGGKKGGAGENTKKVAGNARKAEAAAGKKAVENAKVAAEEDKQWSKGSKSSAKKEDAEAKKAEAARKKAERDAQLAEEEASQPAKAKGANAKSAQKKTRGLDLSQLDDEPGSKKGSSLNASGIDNALDALSLTNKDTSKVERHPERRFKAAYAAYEARRLPEIEEENPGLRRQQRMDLCRKEFEKSEENPFNQVHVKVNATRDEIAQVRDQERNKTEARLGK